MPSALTAWGLSLTLAGLLSLSASPALALGLGRAKMLSKQGESLLVEFDVESLSPEEQQGLEVSLAEAATYSALGAPFDAVLSSAQARLAKRPNGQLYLSVTSKDPVNQSFLDVILQLHWSTGQVTKEMGLLLDTTQSASLNESGNITQVPVNPGDTASELALRYKNASVTLDQMLMGLLRSNPNAFLAQNVNRLRADANLVLPSTEEALSLKAQDASAQVQLQHIDFDQYRAALVAKLQQGKPRAEKNSKQNASGQVGSKAKAPREKKDQLKLSDANAASAKVADQLAQEAQAKIDAQKAQDLSQNIQELNTLLECAKHPHQPGQRPHPGLGHSQSMAERQCPSIGALVGASLGASLGRLGTGDLGPWHLVGEKICCNRESTNARARHGSPTLARPRVHGEHDPTHLGPGGVQARPFRLGVAPGP